MEEDEIKPDDPRIPIGAIYDVLVASVFPPVVQAILKEHQALLHELGRKATTTPAKVFEKLKSFATDAELRFFAMEQATPDEVLTIHWACESFFSVLMSAKLDSEFFRRESGLLIGQMGLLYMCRRGLSPFLSPQDDASDPRSSE